MESVVNRALELIAQQFVDLTVGVGRETAVRALYEGIVNRLRHRGHTGEADAFASDSRQTAVVDAVKRILEADTAFHQELSRLVAAAEQQQQAGTVNQQGNVVYGNLTGRDSNTGTFAGARVSASGNTGPVAIAGGNINQKSIFKQRRTYAVGLAVAALIALIAFEIVNSAKTSATPDPAPTVSSQTTDDVSTSPSGYFTPPPPTTTNEPPPVTTTATTSSPSIPAAAWSAGYDGVTGSSTCRDYLGSPQDIQYEAAEQIALAENNGSAAGDPFLVQNMEYECGSALGAQLALVMPSIG